MKVIETTTNGFVRNIIHSFSQLAKANNLLEIGKHSILGIPPF